MPPNGARKGATTCQYKPERARSRRVWIVTGHSMAVACMIGCPHSPGRARSPKSGSRLTSLGSRSRGPKRARPTKALGPRGEPRADQCRCKKVTPVAATGRPEAVTAEGPLGLDIALPPIGTQGARPCRPPPASFAPLCDVPPSASARHLLSDPGACRALDGPQLPWRGWTPNAHHDDYLRRWHHDGHPDQRDRGPRGPGRRA